MEFGGHHYKWHIRMGIAISPIQIRSLWIGQWIENWIKSNLRWIGTLLLYISKTTVCDGFQVYIDLTKDLTHSLHKW